MSQTLLSTAPLAALFAALGAVVGAAWFGALRLNTRLYLSDGPVWQPVVVLVLRISLVAIAFLVFARSGTMPLLAGLAGFMIARSIGMRMTRRPS